MDEKKIKRILVLAGLASLVVAAQVLSLVLKGTPVCPTQGCQMAEDLTRIPPLYFNLMGLFYFQAILWTALLTRTRPWAAFFLKGLMVAGVTAEGVLVSYQALITHSYCPYCLLIFAFVIGLYFQLGWQSILRTPFILAGEFMVFSLLQLGLPQMYQTNLDLDQGTYAVKSCPQPEKHLYLLFSEKCPHCQNVIKALENCSRCEFHFNPVERIQNLRLPGVQKTGSYLPEINVATLRMLGIDSIPVLIDKTEDGLRIIKGDRTIIDYIEKSCARQEASPLDHPGEDVFSPGGVCSVTKKCE